VELWAEPDQATGADQSEWDWVILGKSSAFKPQSARSLTGTLTVSDLP